MKYYAVIDTNVLVSAMLKLNSLPGKIISLVDSGAIVPLLHGEIMREYREVLTRPKFHFDTRLIQLVVGGMERRGIYIDSKTLEIDLPDPKDRIFYEVTIEKRKSGEAWLVTGNIRHFPVMPFVVTPRQMLQVMEIESQ